jgi:hypothetical protein
MALSSSTLALPKKVGAKVGGAKLLMRHRLAIEEVVADAKSFSEERQRELDKIVDKGLRQSAAR